MGSIFAVGVPRRIIAGAGILAFILVAMLRLAASAHATELLYWDNYNGEPIDSISVANLDGSGGGEVNLTGIALKSPEGMAYDTVSNRLFVANSAGGPKEEGQIDYVNLDGSGAGVFSAPGAPVETPEGIAVDPVNQIVYWVNIKTKGSEPHAASIAWAKLDGSGGGMLSTSGATFEGPYKLAFDPVGGRVFWANSETAKPEIVSFANVNNSGGGDLNLAGAPAPESIYALAVDSTTGRLYWADGEANKIGFASTAGGSGGELGLGGVPLNEPYGLALDPAIGRLYWANYGNKETKTGAFGFASTVGGAGGTINIATAPVNGPQDPVIVKSPTNTERPRLRRRTARSKPGKTRLRCSTGGWAADYPGSFVYQSPRSYAFQWKRNGKVLKGAKATRIVRTPGRYVCLVTATNQAGVATAKSNPVKVKKPPRKHRRHR